MSVLIKGKALPKTCEECLFYGIDAESGCFLEKCYVIRRAGQGKPSWCPLVPVPSHGRLIEENKVLDIVSEWCPDDDGSVGKDGDLREMLDEIEALPIIIPAEEGV